jgi:hypothetical protein
MERLVYAASDVDGRRTCRKFSTQSGLFPTDTDGISPPTLRRPARHRRRTARFMRFESATARGALMTRRSPVPRSPAFEATARGAKFRDRIALHEHARRGRHAHRAQRCAARGDHRIGRSAAPSASGGLPFAYGVVVVWTIARQLRPDSTIAPLSGEPVPIRLGGRYLVRNDRVRANREGS